MSLRQRPGANTVPLDKDFKAPGSGPGARPRSFRGFRNRSGKMKPSGSELKGNKRNLTSYLHLEFVGKRLSDSLHSSVDRAKGRRAAKKAQAKRRAAKKAQESLRRQSVVVGDMMRKLKETAKVKVQRTLGGHDSVNAHGRRRRNHFEFALVLRSRPQQRGRSRNSAGASGENAISLCVWLMVLLTWALRLIRSALGLASPSRAKQQRVSPDGDTRHSNRHSSSDWASLRCRSAADNFGGSNQEREYNMRYTREQVAVIAGLKEMGLEVSAVPFNQGVEKKNGSDAGSSSAQREKDKEQLLVLVTASLKVLQSERDLLQLSAWLRSGTSGDLQHSSLGSAVSAVASDFSDSGAGSGGSNSSGSVLASVTPRTPGGSVSALSVPRKTTPGSLQHAEQQAAQTAQQQAAQQQQQANQFLPAERILLLHSIISRCEVLLPPRRPRMDRLCPYEHEHTDAKVATPGLLKTVTAARNVKKASAALKEKHDIVAGRDTTARRSSFFFKGRHEQGAGFELLMQCGMVVTLFPLHDRVAADALLEKRMMRLHQLPVHLWRGTGQYERDDRNRKQKDKTRKLLQVKRSKAAHSDAYSHEDDHDHHGHDDQHHRMPTRGVCGCLCRCLTRSLHCHVSCRRLGLQRPCRRAQAFVGRKVWRALRTARHHLWLEQRDLDEIRNHFGDEYGFYYAWITHYTQWLTYIATLGVFVVVYEQAMLAAGYANWQSVDGDWGVNKLRLRNVFGLCLSLWAVALLVFWRQRNYELCVLWDLTDLKGVEHRRHEFRAWKDDESGGRILWQALWWLGFRVDSRSSSSHGGSSGSEDAYLEGAYLEDDEDIDGGDSEGGEGGAGGERWLADGSDHHSGEHRVSTSVPSAAVPALKLPLDSSSRSKTSSHGQHKDGVGYDDFVAEEHRRLEEVEEEDDYYPVWLRGVKTIVALPFVIFIILTLFFIVFLIFSFEMWLIFKWGQCCRINNEWVDTNIRHVPVPAEGYDFNGQCISHDYRDITKIPPDQVCVSATMHWGFPGWLAEMTPGLMEALCFELLLQVFTRLAAWLTRWQNYRTEEEHMTAFAWQIFAMEAFGMFAFYLILALGFVPDWYDDDTINLEKCRDFVDAKWFDWLGNVIRLREWSQGYMDINGGWSLSCIKAKAPPALRLQMMISYMVTPFVVSQLLNVLFKTWLPSMVHKVLTQSQQRKLAAQKFRATSKWREKRKFMAKIRAEAFFVRRRSLEGLNEMRDGFSGGDGGDGGADDGSSTSNSSSSGGGKGKGGGDGGGNGFPAQEHMRKPQEQSRSLWWMPVAQPLRLATRCGGACGHGVCKLLGCVLGHQGGAWTLKAEYLDSASVSFRRSIRGDQRREIEDFRKDDAASRAGEEARARSVRVKQHNNALMADDTKKRQLMDAFAAETATITTVTSASGGATEAGAAATTHHLRQRALDTYGGATRCMFNDGDYLMRQGEAVTADSPIFVLRSGVVAILENGRQVAERLSEELAAIGTAAPGSLRTADVVAVGRVECTRMDRYAFAVWIGTDHAMEASLVKHYRQAKRKTKKKTHAGISGGGTNVDSSTSSTSTSAGPPAWMLEAASSSSTTTTATTMINTAIATNSGSSAMTSTPVTPIKQQQSSSEPESTALKQKYLGYGQLSHICSDLTLTPVVDVEAQPTAVRSASTLAPAPTIIKVECPECLHANDPSALMCEECLHSLQASNAGKGASVGVGTRVDSGASHAAAPQSPQVQAVMGAMSEMEAGISAMKQRWRKSKSNTEDQGSNCEGNGEEKCTDTVGGKGAKVEAEGEVVVGAGSASANVSGRVSGAVTNSGTNTHRGARIGEVDEVVALFHNSHANESHLSSSSSSSGGTDPGVGGVGGSGKCGGLTKSNDRDLFDLFNRQVEVKEEMEDVAKMVIIDEAHLHMLECKPHLFARTGAGVSVVTSGGADADTNWLVPKGTAEHVLAKHHRRSATQSYQGIDANAARRNQAQGRVQVQTPAKPAVRSSLKHRQGPTTNVTTMAVAQVRHKVDQDRSAELEQLYMDQVRGALDDLSLWEPNIFNEHCELVLQFCWVCFFSMVFPMGPLCALVNNVIEIRADTYKSCYVNRRPVPKSVSGIGAWFDIMLFIAYSSVLVNLLLIILSLNSLEAYYSLWSWSDNTISSTSASSSVAASTTVSSAAGDSNHSITSNTSNATAIASDGTVGAVQVGVEKEKQAFIEYWQLAMLVVMLIERIVLIILRSIDMNVPQMSASVRRDLKRREVAIKKSYMEIHNLQLEYEAQERMHTDATPLFKIGDRARIIKHGTQLGKTCMVVDPNWGGRVKVQMPGDRKVIKSYSPYELVVM